MNRQACGRKFQLELETTKISLSCRLLEAVREIALCDVTELFLDTSQNMDCGSLLELGCLAGCTFALT